MPCRKNVLYTTALGLMLTTSLSWLYAAQSYEVVVERGVAAKMRDGVTLHADIYRPKADGQFPVLLQRTPSPAPEFDWESPAPGEGFFNVQRHRSGWTIAGDGANLGTEGRGTQVVRERSAKCPRIHAPQGFQRFSQP
jgi:hypothetical protein